MHLADRPETTAGLTACLICSTKNYRLLPFHALYLHTILEEVPTNATNDISK